MNLHIYPAIKLLDKTLVVLQVTDQLKKNIDNMIAIMYENNGVGIAANQVGMTERVMVVVVDDDRPLVMINPELSDHSGEKMNSQEGCLSLPSVKVDVQRYSSVTVKYTDLSGNDQSRCFVGAEAFRVQHELDHLDGKTILQRVGAAQRTLQLSKYNKMRKQAGSLNKLMRVAAAKR